MKNSFRIHLKRIVFAFFFFVLLPFVAHAQKDILLYSSDITDWTALDQSSASSKAIFSVTSGGGNGAILGGEPTVDPTGSVGGDAGYITFASSGGYLKLPSLNFVSGGVVRVLFYVSSANGRTITLVDSTATGYNADSVSFESISITGDASGTSTSNDYTKILAGSTDMAIDDGSSAKKNLSSSKLNKYYAGNSVTVRYVGFYMVDFKLPSTTTGSQQYTISGINTNVDICSIDVYTGVGTTPYVVSTNYAKYPSTGEEFTGTVGGAKYSGTVTNAAVKIKEWNSSSNVNLSITGDAAARFSFSNTTDTTLATVANATALAGTTLNIYFSPSSKAGISNAKLKISANGIDSAYYVRLTGITATGTTPQIIANTDTVAFWTRVITKTSNTISISGVNLTSYITASLTGSGASRFSISVNTISETDATAGTTITITYLGNISAGTQYATLVLKSTGANTVSIPLVGYTYDTKPTTYSFAVDVSPSGSGYATVSPQSASYLSGSKVAVTVTPESGYKLSYWSDRKSGTRTSRTVTISDETEGTLIAYLVKGTSTNADTTDTTSSFVAYVPTNITTTGFTVSWASYSGATSYTVTVYDASGNVVKTATVTGTSTTISGLSTGTQYYYKVTATTSTSTETSAKVGPFKTSGTASTFTCGG